MKRYIIKVQGRVHGVNFRWSTRQKAKGLGLTGFVKNEDNDQVYIEAEGQEDCLEKFLAWCHHGPWFAKVKNVEFEETGPIGYTNFEVKL